jgi:hypothetical protein
MSKRDDHKQWHPWPTPPGPRARDCNKVMAEVPAPLAALAAGSEIMGG